MAGHTRKSLPQTQDFRTLRKMGSRMREWDYFGSEFAGVKRTSSAVRYSPSLGPENCAYAMRSPFARNADHGTIGEPLRFRGMSFLGQAADRRDWLLSVGIAAVALLARQDIIFIQLDTISTDIANDHRSQPAIAYRKGLCTSSGRLLIPEAQGVAVIVECRRTRREIQDEDPEQYKSQSVLLLE